MKNTIKFLLPFFMATLLLNNPVSSQAQSFEPGTSAINAGIGIGYATTYWTDVSAGSYSESPIFMSNYEYGVAKAGPGTLGLGLEVAYQNASATFNYWDGYPAEEVYQTNKWSTFVIGARAAYHPDFCNGKNYDLYCALQLSYVHYGYSFTTTDPQLAGFNGYTSLNSGIRPYIAFGGRYYFGALGVFGELGYDIAYIKGGLCLKFGDNSK